MKDQEIPAAFGIALVGCGTVGGGTAALIHQSSAEIASKTGQTLTLKYIVDKNFDNARKLGLPESILTDSLDKALADPEVKLLVETVGGTGFAKDLIKKALSAGKHVVTANKALLAHYGQELFALARSNNVSIGFEASCGGGIPIIRALYDGLIANRVQAIFGIVNGTCNFILTEMIQKGQSYNDALRDAQKAGFAEADPALDVQGMDAAHKITILSNLAFGLSVGLDDVSVKGIDTLDSQDVASGIELGYVIKLIAQAQREKDGLSVRVEPAFIPKSHPLAWVSGSFNAVSVYGHAVGHTLYYGRGAGAMPTASAVVSDIVGIATGSYTTLFRDLGIWLDKTAPASILSDDKLTRRYYLRLRVQDRPGTLAKIAEVLGSHSISVASIHQPEMPESANVNGKSGPAWASIIITTHVCTEATIKRAVDAIVKLPQAEGSAALIPILEEHPEFTSL